MYFEGARLFVFQTDLKGLNNYKASLSLESAGFFSSGRPERAKLGFYRAPLYWIDEFFSGKNLAI